MNLKVNLLTLFLSIVTTGTFGAATDPDAQNQNADKSTIGVIIQVTPDGTTGYFGVVKPLTGETREIKIPEANKKPVHDAGELVKLTKQKDWDNDKKIRNYDIDGIGTTLTGTVVEISKDNSLVIVRTQRKERTALAVPNEDPKVREQREKNEAAEREEREARGLPAQLSNNLNVSFRADPKFQPVIAAMKRGDGINATYEFSGDGNKLWALEWQSAPVNRFSGWLSLLGSAAILFLVACIFTWGKPTSLILGEDNRYSTSKFQAGLWFWLVISGYMAIVFYRMRSAGWDYIGGVDIPPNLLLLSGISVLTYAGAKAITQSQVDQAAAKGEVARTNAIEPAVNNLITSKGGRVDLGDYQMVIITILAVAVYAVSVVEFMRYIEFRREVTMPDVDATLLTIFGLGQAAYLGKKYAGDTPSAHTPDTALDATNAIALKAKAHADKAVAAASLAKSKVDAANALVPAAKSAAGDPNTSKPRAVELAEELLASAKAARSDVDTAMASAKSIDAKVQDAKKYAADWGKGELAPKFNTAAESCQAEASRAMNSVNDADAKVKALEAAARQIRDDADRKN